LKSSIHIFWPVSKALRIEETEFSYKFCRKTSKKLCKVFFDECFFTDYFPEQSFKQIQTKAKSNVIVLVTNPELVLSPVAIDKLKNSVEKLDFICGPVYNETSFSDQMVSLNIPYLNLSTYLEIAKQKAVNNSDNLIYVDRLDPACVLFPKKILENIKESTITLYEFLENITKFTDNKKILVDKSALIHCFGNYYDTSREDLINLVPENIRNILDVGCAKGGYGKRIKVLRPEIYLTGVESNSLMADIAKNYYDEIIISKIEDINIDKKFDLINCGDVIEHLYNPWEMLKNFCKLLRKGGYLVTSLPNTGHWSIVKDLLKGNFDYIPVGLQCIAHIRWFTEYSIKQALKDSGFFIDVFQKEKVPPTEEGEKFIKTMCKSGYGDEDSLKTNEFIIRVKK
jgi:2-polyprenyl-3-methyl-5-hydroxy-6-metoxy-1,4-benzoquinol methylase